MDAPWEVRCHAVEWCMLMMTVCSSPVPVIYFLSSSFIPRYILFASLWHASPSPSPSKCTRILLPRPHARKPRPLSVRHGISGRLNLLVVSKLFHPLTTSLLSQRQLHHSSYVNLSSYPLPALRFILYQPHLLSYACFNTYLITASPLILCLPLSSSHISLTFYPQLAPPFILCHLQLFSYPACLISPHPPPASPLILRQYQLFSSTPCLTAPRPPPASTIPFIFGLRL